MKGNLLKLLFNSPGNIFLGTFPRYKRAEGAIEQCQDFPRKGKYVDNKIQQTDQMTSHALSMQSMYKKFGLELFESSEDLRKRPATDGQGNKKSEIQGTILENGCSQNSSLAGCGDTTNRLKKINREANYRLTEQGTEHKLQSKYRIPRGIGVGIDFGSVEFIDKEDHKKIGIHGPGAKANVGPLGVGFIVGAGAEVSGDVQKGIGGKVITPSGSFGVKFGCVNEICLFGCFKIKIC